MNTEAWRKFEFLGKVSIKNPKWNSTMDYLTKMIDKTFFIYEPGLSI